MPAKTLAFFKAVTAAYDAKYIIKVDDDAYLRIWALPQAVKQWQGLSAGVPSASVCPSMMHSKFR